MTARHHRRVLRVGNTNYTQSILVFFALVRYNCRTDHHLIHHLCSCGGVFVICTVQVLHHIGVSCRGDNLTNHTSSRLLRQVYRRVLRVLHHHLLSFIAAFLLAKLCGAITKYNHTGHLFRVMLVEYLLLLLQSANVQLDGDFAIFLWSLNGGSGWFHLGFVWHVKHRTILHTLLDPGVYLIGQWGANASNVKS